MQQIVRKTAAAILLAGVCMVSQALAVTSAYAMGDGPIFQLPAYMAVPYDPMIAYWEEPAGTSQIGATGDVAWQGRFGQGVTIGIVDDGIYENDPAFTGRISALSHNSSGSAHGTLVARIAAGAPGGVAPWATIVSETIGTSKGIMEAADAGASVINVSRYHVLSNTVDGGTGLKRIDAINYATSKGAIVVVAAGNSNQSYFGEWPATHALFGFTEEALSRIVVVGAVDSGNYKQGISNYAGTDFIGTTGTQTWYWELPDGTLRPFDAGCDPYCDIFLPTVVVNDPTGPVAMLESIWLMAPASYTSYAAPEVTGAIALIQARWPVVKRNGTAAQVLFASAQDLGDTGVDGIYGNGLVRVDLAFDPIGTLSVLTAGGSQPLDPILDNIRNLQSSGALGSMPSLAASLRSFSVFDTFDRDFKVDLLSMIGVPSSSSSLAQAAIAPTPTVSSVYLADGSSLSFGNVETIGDGISNPLGEISDQSWFVSFTDASGSTVAAGQGFPASASFAQALWGQRSFVSDHGTSLNIAQGVASLAEGGHFAALGTPLSKQTRVAFGWSQSKEKDPVANDGWVSPDANAFTAGISTKLAKGWSAGITFGLLNEHGGLLGATYDPNGPLNLGKQHQSLSFGVSSGFDLGGKTSLLLEAAISRSDGATTSNSLITDVSPLYARSMGASLVRRDAITEGDSLSLSLKSPLRVFSGSVGLAMTSVDADGYATTAVQRVGLKPNGNELRLSAGYQAPVRDDLEWNVSLEGRHDADNIAGNNEVVGRVGMKLAF